MLSFAELRSQAEHLAAGLPPFGQVNGYRTTAHSGAASRQRAGQGEDFWQYRNQVADDPASSIDWRRSAAGDELYVREHELQSARLLSVWADASAGFDWRSDENLLTKADAARIVLTALAVRYRETGDMAGVIGGPNGVSNGHHMIGPIVDDFLHVSGAMPLTPRPDTAQIILASDFYGDLHALTEWVEREATEGRRGILLQVVDPAERDFPYMGRIRFRLPGSGLERIFGRTEIMKPAYLERFEARRAALDALCNRVGWVMLTHATDAPLLSCAYELMSLLHLEAAG